MTEVERLREQAARCLRLARGMDGPIAERLKALSADYLAQAEVLEALQPAPMEAPPSESVQKQQQIQPENEGDDKE